MKTGRQINENNERQYYLNTGKTLCQDTEGTSIEGLSYDLNQYAKKSYVEKNFLRIPEEGEYYKKPDSGIPSEDIANGAITSNKIASDAITVSKIADLNVTSNKISNSAVTTNKIAPRAVTGEKLDYFCIGAEHISNNFKEVYLQIKQEEGNIDDTSQNLVTIDNEPYYYGSQLINLKKKQVLVVEAILKPQYADSFFEISLINSSKTGVVYPEYSPYSYIPDQDISIYIGFKDGVDADKYALDHIEYTIYDTLESVLERVKQLENNN